MLLADLNTYISSDDLGFIYREEDDVETNVLPGNKRIDNMHAFRNTSIHQSNSEYGRNILELCIGLQLRILDSKTNRIRHFIKIPFINKGMDVIDLPSIFRDKSVQSSIPIVKYQSFVANIINLLGALYLISIILFLILISKSVTLTPETARTVNMFIRLRVMLLRSI